MDAHPLSLYELNALVKRSITSCMPDTYWLQAELSDVRSNYSGHCYLEFVQKEPRGNNLIAKARGTIWNNVYRLLKPYFEEETGYQGIGGSIGGVSRTLWLFADRTQYRPHLYIGRHGASPA